MKIKILSIIFSLCALLAGSYKAESQTFDPKFARTDGQVNAIAQKGDTVYIGGQFSETGFGAERLARFSNGNTKPDVNFPGLGSGDYVSVVEPDSAGGVYLLGYFDSYNGASIPTTNIIHILNGGTLDAAFGPVIFDNYYYYGYEALKKYGNVLYVGGLFNTIQGVTRPYLAALNATTGNLLPWTPDAPDYYVNKIEATDSSVYISGSFSYVGNVYQPQGFAVLNASTGKLRNDFLRPNSSVQAMHKSGNSLFLGGYFTQLGQYAQGVAKINNTTIKSDDNFPHTDGYVYAVLADGSGGYFIGGSFSRVGNTSRSNIAHILSNGTVDSTFNVTLNNQVICLASDGTNLFFSGYFTQVNGSNRNYSASVSISGGQLTPFNPNTNDLVTSIAVVGSNVYLGGYFTTIRGGVNNRNYAACITTSNVVTSWNPNPDWVVEKIVLNNNGTSVFLAGRFSTIRGQNIPYLAKVNSTTGVPSSWKPNPNSYVFELVLAGSTAYVGGYFNQINGVDRQSFAAIDTATNTPTALRADLDNSAVHDLFLLGNKIYISGSFTTIQDSSRNRIARIDLSTGLVDSWKLNVDNSIYSISADANGTCLGGDFYLLSAINRDHIAEINLQTNQPTSFAPADFGGYFQYANSFNAIYKTGNNLFLGGDFNYFDGINESRNLVAFNTNTGKASFNFAAQYPNASVVGLAIDNNKLLVTGNFTDIMNNNTSVAKRKYMASYNLTGFSLASDIYDPNSPVAGFYHDAAGKLVAAGNFTLFNSKARSNLAAININTGDVTDWDPSANSTVYALAVRDTTIFVGGTFTQLGYSSSSPITRNKLAAISEVSGKTTSWRADVNGTVNCLSITDTTMYVGGSFTIIKSNNKSNAAAVSTNAGIVSPWTPNPNGAVSAILRVDTSIYLGGTFTTVKSQARQYLAKTNTSTGAPLAWNPAPDNSIKSFSLQGSFLYVGGAFYNIAGQQRGSLASFNIENDELTDFNANINPGVNGYSLNASAPYGRFLYVGSDYISAIGSENRGNLAAVDTATNQPTAFNPVPNSYVHALLAAKNKLFAGGDYYQLEGKPNAGYFSVFTLEPQTPATSLTFTNLQLNSVTANWTAGSGENRIVVVRQGGPSASPNDGSTYNTNSIFGAGSQIGTGGRAVYKGAGNNVTVTNLKPNRTYYFSVYEYNGSGSATDYLQSPVLTDSITTPCPVYTDKISPPSDTVYVCAGAKTTLTAPAGFVSYTWSSADSTTAVTVGKGSYTVTVTDTNGCHYTTPPVVVLERSAMPKINPAGPVHLCAGDSITLTIAGGTYPSINWSNTATTSSIVVRTAGDYSATVVDSFGCNYNTPVVTVSKSDSINPVITPAGPISLCNGQSVTLSVAGGSFEKLLWNTGQTSSSISVDSAGSYAVTAEDAFGCTGSSAPVTVTVRPPVSPVVTPAGPITLCPGNTATLSLSNGPFSSVMWNTGDTTNSITVSSGGSYSVTAKDEAGCTGTSNSVIVNSPAKPTITYQPSDGLCRGSSLTLTASAASSYSWNTGATTQSITTTTNGSFAVTVIYPGGCTATSDTAKITYRGCGAPLNRKAIKINAYSATVKWRRVACANAYAVEYRQAGDSAYNVARTTDTSFTIPNLLASMTYEWRLRSLCGQYNSKYTPNLSFTTESGINTKPDLGPDTTIGKCAGFTTDLRKVYVTRYYPTVIWSTPTPGTAETGVYTLIVGNQFGKDTVKINVINNPKPNLGNDTTVYICTGTVRSIENVYNTSGYASVDYSTTRPDIAAEGTYSIIVTNRYGCSDTAQITVLTESAFNPVITANGPTTFCKGDSVVVTVTNGNIVSAVWSDGSTGNPNVLKKAGSYRALATNNHGCTAYTPFIIITTMAPPVPVITANPAATWGLCPGTTVFLTSSAGNNAWSTGETTATINVNTTAKYVVTTTDANGCTSSAFKSVSYQKCIRPSGTNSTDLGFNEGTVYWNHVPCISSYEVDYRMAGTSTYTTTVASDTFLVLQGLQQGTKYEWRVRSMCSGGPSDYTFVKTFTTRIPHSRAFAENSTIESKTMADKLALNVFPNPATTSAVLEVKGNNKEFAIRISTSDGRKVWQTEKQNGNRVTLPISNLRPGLYFVTFNNGVEEKTARLLIENNRSF